MEVGTVRTESIAEAAGNAVILKPPGKSSGLTGKGGLGPYYVQQFAREQSRTIVD